MCKGYSREIFKGLGRQRHGNSKHRLGDHEGVGVVTPPLQHFKLEKIKSLHRHNQAFFKN